MRLGIAEIINKVGSTKDRQERIEILRKNDHPVVRGMFAMNFDQNLEWDLPEGDPPYKANNFPDQHGMLYSEWRRMYLFHKGGNPNLKPFKREMLFINLLESLDKEDAKVLLAVKNKKLHHKYPVISEKLVREAYPGLLNG